MTGVARVSIALLMTLVPQLASADPAPMFFPLGSLSTRTQYSKAFDVSSDGAVVVGETAVGVLGGSRDEAFYWTVGGGMVALGVVDSEDQASAARAVSPDGSLIAGFSRFDAGSEAFLWRAADGMLGLGFLPDGSQWTQAADVSAMGEVVVGTAVRSWDGKAIASRWTAGSGWQELGLLGPFDVKSDASRVSGDGSLIIGRSGALGFRWTSGQGLQPLETPPGGCGQTVAHDMSPDGSLIVGACLTVGPTPLRWTLGVPESLGGTGQAALTSADGSVIAISSGKDWYLRYAGIGELPFRDLVAGHGFELGQWSSIQISRISDDGFTFVGWGTNPVGKTEAWVTVLPIPVPEPSASLGLLTAIVTIAVLTGARRSGSTDRRPSI